MAIHPMNIYTQTLLNLIQSSPYLFSFSKEVFPDKTVVSPEKAASLVDNPKYRASSSDAVFMTSRGGGRFDRTFMEAFIRPGPEVEDWVARDNTPALGMIPGSNNNLYLYRMSHYAQATAHVTRYSLRLDGFASVLAGYEGGELTTRWFRFRGRHLEINSETSAAGGIRVEIQDANGSPFPGYSLNECLEIVENDFQRIVTWKNGSDVSRLEGQPVRILFQIKDGDLYSIRFRE